MAVGTMKKSGFMSVSEVCNFLGLSRPTVYAMMDRKELASIKIGAVHRIPRRAVERLVERAK
jgi:excisionase family DNA binding protein